MMSGRWLVNCEASGTVREALRRRGIDAWSGDLREAEDGSPYHIVEDALVLAYDKEWAGMVAHPPCPKLTVAAAWCMYHPDDKALSYDERRPHPKYPDRRQEQGAAARFFTNLAKAPIPRKVIENPVGVMSTQFRKPDQIVQPYQFGHDASKTTCLWLEGVPPLTIDPAAYCKPRMVCKVCGGVSNYDAAFGHGCVHCGAEAGMLLPRWANQTNSGQNRLSPGEDRWRLRSLTYSGIAEAIADAVVRSYEPERPVAQIEMFA